MSQVVHERIGTTRQEDIPPGVPVIMFDPYSDEVMSNPYPYYQEMREAGPLIWMQKYGTYAVGSYNTVVRVLTDHDTFCSSAGVGFTNFHTETPWRKPSIILEVDPARIIRAPARYSAHPLAAIAEQASRPVRAGSAGHGIAPGGAGCLRRRQGFRRGLSAESVRRCRRAAAGRPRAPASLRGHGVQRVWPSERSLSSVSGQARSFDRVDQRGLPAQEPSREQFRCRALRRGRCRRTHARGSRHAGTDDAVGRPRHHDLHDRQRAWLFYPQSRTMGDRSR